METSIPAPLTAADVLIADINKCIDDIKYYANLDDVAHWLFLKNLLYNFYLK